MRADSDKGSPLTIGLLRTLRNAFDIFDRKARRQLIMLLILMVVGAAVEAIGAAVIVPFIAIVNDPSYITSNSVLSEFYLRSQLATPGAFITATSLLLFAFFVCKNVYLTMMANAQFRFIYSEMPRFSSDLFSKYMVRPLAAHVQTNSAEMIRNVSNEVFMFFTNFLIPAMTLLTEALVTIAMIAVLLWMAPFPTLIAIVLLGGGTKLFYGFIRSKINHYGKLQQLHNAERMKWVNQGLQSIKEAKVLGREQYFIERFHDHETYFSQSARYAMLLSQTPRLFIETLAFAGLFLGVAIALMAGQDSVSILPILALFAVAAVRLLPSLNRSLLSITRMAYYRSAADVVLDAYEVGVRCGGQAEQPSQFAERSCPAPLKWRELKFDNVYFAYPGADDVLVNLNLTIRRGTSVALIGPSGSGKTTIADLALGLLCPTKGSVLLDGKDIQSVGEAWRKLLGYIPQSIYLLDDSIRRNVAFGLPDEDIDDERVWVALSMARLDEHVRELAGQLAADIGENGSKLSGGQRQRLGIARALYDDPDFIVMDEATSALDEATEREVAETLDSLRGVKTILVIAHRPETISRCQYKFSVNRQAYVS
jgi:ABC-type multidrug transport system fused ATPase/permease subunit